MPARLPDCRVLIVDDDLSERQMLQGALAEAAAEVVTARDGAEALRLAERGRFTIAITDVRMPGMDGHELLKRLKALDPEMDVLLITAFGTVDAAVRSMREGASDYLLKPFSIEELRIKIEKACCQRRLRLENQRLRGELRDGYDLGGGSRMIGSSPAMRDVYRKIEAVSRNRSNVFIEGETGAGKELVARAIHTSGPRAGAPFLAFNCAGVPKDLLESQLFGHLRGSFTGAVGDSPGVFLAADGGTIFLDEITEMDIDTQAKLLRVIQEREVTPVGGIRPVRVDVRAIAATNLCAEDAVRSCRLREDLYYRLSVVVITVPPLRARSEDVPALVEQFSRELAREYQAERLRFEPEALAALVRHDWPGNVRELRNVVERLYALGARAAVELAQLPANIRERRRTLALDSGGEVPTLAEGESALVRRALEKSLGNKSRAAEMLGIDRKRLYRLIRKYRVA